MGAIQRRFVSAFDYVLACVGQRGSRSRRTGDMVYRMGMAMEGCRPWIGHGSIWDYPSSAICHLRSPTYNPPDFG